MRGVRAKGLRRQAERDTVGRPALAYQWHRRSRKDGGGDLTLRLAQMCTRWAYKQLKRHWKRSGLMRELY